MFSRYEHKAIYKLHPFLPLSLLRPCQGSLLPIGHTWQSRVWITQQYYTRSPEHLKSLQRQREFLTCGWVFFKRDNSVKVWWVLKITSSSKREQTHLLHNGEELLFGEFIKLLNKAMISSQIFPEFWPVSGFTTRQEKQNSNWAFSLQCSLLEFSEYCSMANLNQHTAYLQTGNFLGYCKCCNNNINSPQASCCRLILTSLTAYQATRCKKELVKSLKYLVNI